jgi:hypothetical protein
VAMHCSVFSLVTQAMFSLSIAQWQTERGAPRVDLVGRGYVYD